MEDIATRLRSWVKHELQESDPAAVILQAADEIDRLRALVDSLLQERLQVGRQAVAQESEPTREQLYSFHHRLMAMGGVVGRFWGQ